MNHDILPYHGNLIFAFQCNAGMRIEERITLAFLIICKLSSWSQSIIDQVSFLACPLSQRVRQIFVTRLLCCRRVKKKRLRQRRRRCRRQKARRRQRWPSFLFLWYLILGMKIEQSTRQFALNFGWAISRWSKENRRRMNAALLHLYVWTMSRRLRNKLAHTVNGNGGEGKSKGKNKNAKTDAFSDQPVIATGDFSASNTSENTDYEFRAAIEAALPEAAKLRTQTQLIASQWNVPAIPYQKHDGVALVPKKALPMVLGQVGWTSCRVAALVTEDPTNLGLWGFIREQVRCSASVIDENNERVTITITQWLVQLGFALPVEQLMAGEQVNMYVTMRKLQIRLPQDMDFFRLLFKQLSWCNSLQSGFHYCRCGLSCQRRGHFHGSF